MKKISEIPKDERPREKLLKRGAKALSDLELMAVLLGKGVKGCDVMALSKKIITTLDSSGGTSPAYEKILSIEGIGPAKGAAIYAALEFARRRIRPEGIKISFPADVLPLISHLSDRKQEHFITISLNGANEVIQTRIVSVGLVNKAQVHPREVFADPITDRATGVVVAHNHPSGTLLPSKEDTLVTKRLVKAGDVLGIGLLDHIIFNRKGYYSFLDHGDL